MWCDADIYRWKDPRTWLNTAWDFCDFNSIPLEPVSKALVDLFTPSYKKNDFSLVIIKKLLHPSQ